MKIAKRKDPAGWRITFDGAASPLLIVKGDPPRYREPQEYWLTDDGETFFLQAKSVHSILTAVERIALTPNAERG